MTQACTTQGGADTAGSSSSSINACAAIRAWLNALGAEHLVSVEVRVEGLGLGLGLGLGRLCF